MISSPLNSLLSPGSRLTGSGPSYSSRIRFRLFGGLKSACMAAGPGRPGSNCYLVMLFLFSSFKQINVLIYKLNLIGLFGCCTLRCPRICVRLETSSLFLVPSSDFRSEMQTRFSCWSSRNITVFYLYTTRYIDILQTMSTFFIFFMRH